MAFLESLRREGVLGGGTPSEDTGRSRRRSPKQSNVVGLISNLMPFINELRNMDLAGLEREQEILGGAPRGRLRRTFDPEQQQEEQQTQNVVFQPSMTDYQRAELGLRERSLQQASRLGEERLQTQKERLELDQLKNQQIYETKLADMERRVNDSQQRLQLAYDQLQGRRDDASAMMQFRNAQMEAVTARHELSMAQRDRELAETQRLNDARMQQMTEAAERGGYEFREEVNPAGEKWTTVVRRGGQAKATARPVTGKDVIGKEMRGGDIRLPSEGAISDPRLKDSTPMIGQDGKTYYVPNDKVNEAVTKYNMKYKNIRTGREF